VLQRCYASTTEHCWSSCVGTACGSRRRSGAGSMVTSQVRAYDQQRMLGRDGRPSALGQDPVPILVAGRQGDR
jgi:hypothetical protein